MACQDRFIREKIKATYKTRSLVFFRRCKGFNTVEICLYGMRLDQLKVLLKFVFFSFDKRVK